MPITVLENPAQTGFLDAGATAASRLNDQRAAFDTARQEWNAIMQKKADILSKAGQGGLNPTQDAALRELTTAANAYNQHTNYDEDGNPYFRANPYQTRVVDPMWQQRMGFERAAEDADPADPRFTVYKDQQGQLSQKRTRIAGVVNEMNKTQSEIAEAKRLYDLAVQSGDTAAAKTFASEIQQAENKFNTLNGSYKNQMNDLKDVEKTLLRARNTGAAAGQTSPYNTGQMSNGYSSGLQDAINAVGKILPWNW